MYNNNWWIIILILLFFGCGNYSFNGCCGNNCGCGCNNSCGNNCNCGSNSCNNSCNNCGCNCCTATNRRGTEHQKKGGQRPPFFCAQSRKNKPFLYRFYLHLQDML